MLATGSTLTSSRGFTVASLDSEVVSDDVLSRDYGCGRSVSYSIQQVRVSKLENQPLSAGKRTLRVPSPAIRDSEQAQLAGKAIGQRPCACTRSLTYCKLAGLGMV